METTALAEVDGATTLTWTLTFADRTGRDHMTAFDGVEANFDNVEELLGSLVNPA